MNEKAIFGHLDNSYQAAGEEEGLQKLSSDFYEIMDELPEAKIIRDMHPNDLKLSIEKLALFLCGWLGGPKKFQDKFGSIHIPKFHSHLIIDSPEKEAWLTCMELALAKQDYSDEFKKYMLVQLRVPAERIQAVARKNK